MLDGLLDQHTVHVSFRVFLPGVHTFLNTGRTLGLMEVPDDTERSCLFGWFRRSSRTWPNVLVAVEPNVAERSSPSSNVALGSRDASNRAVSAGGGVQSGVAHVPFVVAGDDGEVFVCRAVSLDYDDVVVGDRVVLALVPSLFSGDRPLFSWTTTTWRR